MTALRTDYEDAVILAIKAALLHEDLPGGATGGYLKLVAPYNGSLSPSPDDSAFLRLLENGTPAVGVTTGGGEYDNIAIRRRKATLTTSLDLLVCSSIFRSQEAHQRGDTIDSDPGIYQIIEDLRDVLFGEELDVDGVGFANPASEAAVLREDGLTVWHLSYEVPMDALRDDPGADDDDYETIRTQINNADDDTLDPLLESDFTI